MCRIFRHCLFTITSSFHDYGRLWFVIVHFPGIFTYISTIHLGLERDQTVPDQSARTHRLVWIYTVCKKM